MANSLTCIHDGQRLVLGQSDIPGGETGLLRFQVAASDEHYGLWIQKGGKLPHVLRMLAEASSFNRDGDQDVSVDVVQFLRYTDEAMQIKFVRPNTSVLHAVGYQCIFTRPSKTAQNVNVYAMNRDYNTSCNLVFRGSPSEAAKWANSSPSIHFLVDKVVRFHYEGGTTPGERVVKVNNVAANGDGLTLKGKDVRKDEHRCYCSHKITGDIHILA